MQGGGEVVLTDYDTVTAIGHRSTGGNQLYSSPSVEQGNAVQAADDVFALAASFFHILFDRDPFLHGREWNKGLGLSWNNTEREEYPNLFLFCDKATNPVVGERFNHAADALAFLRTSSRGTCALPLPPRLSEQVAPWLTELLSAYPGSRHGNSETRGLDSSFAVATYVETRLDQALLREIENRDVSLVILFGNAGDGKTAFLQHLLQELGEEKPHSSQRVSKHRLPDGRELLVNLDGSAAWNGKRANVLLTELFAPFQEGEGGKKRLHIVAVNSGKLLEWIEDQPEETRLIEQLRLALEGDDKALHSRFRLIDLNSRSLVGGIDYDGQSISTGFLDALLDRLLGNRETTDPWAPCTLCIAQERCTARQSVIALRDPDRGRRIREQLTDALQACHQRGEIHITARELRAALSYIFFGIYDCRELHADQGLFSGHFADRVFDADSPNRQGELLAELARFDPSLESHPAIDRELRRAASSQISLATLRRSAFFGPDSNIHLAQGRHLDRFRRVPLMSEDERTALLRLLCQGIARLEDLPEIAFDRSNGIPLRITPRTPTESAFWVVKPWSRFRLEAPLPAIAEGLETLHTHLHLVYRVPKGHEERLVIGLEIFHLLLDLAAGVQLAGIGQEGIFANLEIFTQRLAREDARELHGWHPAAPGRVDRLQVINLEGCQVLTREAMV